MKSSDIEPNRGAGRLRRFWSGKHRMRLLLTLELAVMLPAAALIFVNFYQLKSFQRDRVLEAAFQREFQQMLAISEKQMNMKAYRLVEEVRELLPSPDAAEAEKVRALDRLLEKRPWVEHVFFYDDACGFLYRTQPRRMGDAYVAKEHDRNVKTFGGWLAMEGKTMLETLHKKPRPVWWQGERVKRSTGYEYRTNALLAVPGVPKGRVVLAGMSFEPEYLRRKFFPEMLDALIAYNLAEGGGNRMAMSVFPADSEAESAADLEHGGALLAGSQGWPGGKPEVTRNLDEVFRGLALGIKFEGTSVEALGRGIVRRNFLTLGVLSVLLVGGLALTYRSVTKEMALAKLKSDFVSNVSHELRTPLSLIRLYAETLELGRISGKEKVAEYYRIIRNESERLTALINNILDFSRIEAGRKEYEFRQTDLAELVRNTLDTYRDQIDEHGFTFEQSIDPGIPPVQVDREAIARSLVNLLNNALKYSDRDKYLRVRLYRDDGAAKLEVADRGIGIARNEQAKIFDKFYRAGDPLVHNTKGSGLGLSLVRHIAHAHGGEVDVESTPGKGSTFTLTLPLGAAAGAPARDEGLRMA